MNTIRVEEILNQLNRRMSITEGNNRPTKGATWIVPVQIDGDYLKAAPVSPNYLNRGVLRLSLRSQRHQPVSIYKQAHADIGCFETIHGPYPVSAHRDWPVDIQAWDSEYREISEPLCLRKNFGDLKFQNQRDRAMPALTALQIAFRNTPYGEKWPDTIRLPSAETLVLVGSSVQEIRVSKVESECEGVSVLHLVDNEISEYPRRLSRCRHLRILSLMANKIERIPEDATSGMDQLRVYNLSYNRLTWLPESFGRDLRNLMELSVDNNRLKSLPESIVELTHLRVLRAEFNELTKLPEGLYRLDSLVELSIHNNKLEELPQIPTDCFGNLSILDASCNKIRAIPDSIVRAKNLRKLYLEHNFLGELPNSLFQHSMNRLVHLDVSHNCIGQLPVARIRDDICFLALSHLNLAHNIISWIPERLFALRKLEILDLCGNMLDQFPMDIAFPPYKSLSSVDLSSNLIETMPELGMRYLPKLRLLYLWGNEAAYTSTARRNQREIMRVTKNRCRLFLE